MRALIVYYSKTGTNEKLCQELQKELSCDLEKITDKTDRSGFWKFILSGRDALTKKMTEIEPIQKGLEFYDIIIVGTPFWAGSLPPATRTFLAKYKDGIKRLAVASVSGNGESNKKVSSDIEAASGKKIQAFLALSDKEYKSGAYQEKFDIFINAIRTLQKVKGDLHG